MESFSPIYSHITPRFIREADVPKGLPRLTDHKDREAVLDFTEDSVGGFFSREECGAIYDLARAHGPDGVAVEIGSWKGKSTICLGSGLKARGGGELFAIDSHEGSEEHAHVYGKVWTFDEFVNNIERARLTDVIVPLVMTSWYGARVLGRPVSLLFVDGSHNEEDVEMDLFLWSHKVVIGGLIVFHDVFSFEAVNRVWSRCIRDSGIFEVIGEEGDMAWARKIKEINYDFVENEWEPSK